MIALFKQAAFIATESIAIQGVDDLTYKISRFNNWSDTIMVKSCI